MKDEIYVSHGDRMHPQKGCWKCLDCIRVKEEFIKSVLDGSFTKITGIKLTKEQVEKLTRE